MSLTACRRRSAALLASFLAVPAAAATSPNAYSGYTTSVAGSARKVAMAGAFIAAPDSFAATFTNPAGLSITSRATDLGILSQNRIKDVVVDLNDARLRKKLDRSLNYIFSGVSHRFRNGWGVGAAYVTPFKIARDYERTRGGFAETHHAEIDVNTLTVAVAKDLWRDRLAVGVGLDYWYFREAYSFTTTDPTGSTPNLISLPRVASGFDKEVTSWAIMPHAGVIWRANSWLQVGAAGQPEVEAPFDPLINDPGLPRGVTWFRDVKVPARLAAGAAMFPAPGWRVHVESNYVLHTDNAVLVGDSFFGGVTRGLPEGRFDVADFRWGSEIQTLDRRNLKAWVWSGGYYETTRTQGVSTAYSRYHNTVGAHIDPWVLKVSVAYDVAEFYENFAFGVGADLRRILGWAGVRV